MLQAAEYFKIKLIVVPVGPDLRLSAATVKRYMTRNTAIIVASAPGFPHGVIDDIEAIAKVPSLSVVCLLVSVCHSCFGLVACFGEMSCSGYPCVWQRPGDLFFYILFLKML